MSVTDGCVFGLWFAVMAFEPLHTIDKADMPLMHHKFNGIEVLSAFKASCQIVLVIDGGVKAFAQRAGKGQLTGVVSSGKRKKVFNDVGYRYLVTQKG